MPNLHNQYESTEKTELYVKLLIAMYLQLIFEL